MKLSTVASLAYGCIGVIADLKTIQGSFVNIQTATSTLNGAILSVNSNPQSAMGIATAAKGVEDALAKARDDVGATDPITLADDPILQSTANGLSSTVKITIMSMMLQRPMLDQVSATSQVLQTLMNQDMLAGQLGANVLSKLPPEGIPGAQMAFGGAAGSIKLGISMLSQAAPPLAQMPQMPGLPPQPPAGGITGTPPAGSMNGTPPAGAMAGPPTAGGITGAPPAKKPAEVPAGGSAVIVPATGKATAASDKLLRRARLRFKSWN